MGGRRKRQEGRLGAGRAKHQGESGQAPAIYTRAAATKPGTWSEADRTVEVVWTTGAAIPRFRWTWDGKERYEEQLSLEPGAAQLERLNNGAPFLAQHSVGGMLDNGREALRDVLGVVVEGSAKIADGIGTATIRFSERADIQDIVQDIRDGVLRNISVGYDPKNTVITERADGPHLHLVTLWEPYELSAVAMGADDGAMFRSRPTPEPDGARTAPYQEAQMAETPQTPIQTQAPEPPAAPVIDLDAERKKAAEEAEQRAADRDTQLRAACKRLGLNMADDKVEAIVADRKRSVADQREALFELAAKRDDAPGISPAQRAGVEVGDQDEAATRSEGLINALLHRANPGLTKLDDKGREVYREVSSLVRLCEYALRANGRPVPVSPRKIVSEALRLRGSGLQTRAGYHTTSDFPLLLADVMGKRLRRAYDETPRTFVPWCRRETAPDFKDVKRLQLGAAPNLLVKVENGEVTYGTIGESREVYALATYARAVALTREMLVNDDLSAFDRLPQAFGSAAARLESDVVYGILTDNAPMADGVALFAGGHSNVSDAAAVPSITTLGAFMTTLARQTGLDGTSILNLLGRFVIVPVTQRLVTEQAIGTTRLPAAPADSVPGYLQSLTVIPEPRLDAASTTVWYGAGDPSQCDTVEYMYLEGEEGVAIDTEVGFEIDGVKVKATLDFAAKAIDHRNLYRNAA